MPDYDAIAAQVGGGGGSSVDYDALAAKVGGRASEDVQKAKAMRAVGFGLPGGDLLPDAAMGVAQGVGALGQMFGRAVSGFTGENAQTGRGWENVNQAIKDFYEKNAQPDATVGAGPAAIARGLGQSAIAGPLMPAMKGAGIVKTALTGAGQGAAGGVLEPVYDAGDNSDFWSKKGKQAGAGAATGGVLTGALGVAGRVLSPSAAGPEQQLLADAKIRLSPGQAAGGFMKSMEDWAYGFPVLKEIIGKVRGIGIMDFNKAVYARATQPFGDEGAAVVRNAEVGNKGIAKVGDFLSSKYEEALGRSAPAPYDDALNAALDNLSSMVPTAKAQDFANTLKRAVFDKFTPESTITPSVAKAADSELGRLAAQYMGSSSADDRIYAGALRQASIEMRDLMARYNPDTAPIIKAANEGWRTLVQIENAGSMVGARNGIFTPAQFFSAGVKKSDKTLRDAATARGEAFNQDLGNAARNVMTQDIPDTGSGGRAALGIAAHLAATGGLGTLSPLAAIPGVTLAALYGLGMTKGGRATGDLLKNVAPYLALPAGAAAASYQ